MTKEANKQTRVLRRLAMAGALIVAAGLGAGATFLGYGVDANLPWPVTANTTIAAKYCGGTVLAGTGSTGQFTLTLPAVTGFPSNCSVLIKNGDTTNGKILSGFPSDLNSILYPQQSLGVKIVNGVWQTFYNPGPWNRSAGGVTLYASPTGSDSNDCLTTGTACTLGHVCAFRTSFGTFFGLVNIQLADGTYNTPDGAGQMCHVTGNAGGSSSMLTSINGNASHPTNVIIAIQSGNNGIVVEDGGEAGINHIEFTNVNGGGPGIQCRQNAVCDYSDITWGAWGNSGSHVAATGVAVSVNPGNETLLANTSFLIHWNLSAGAQMAPGGTTTVQSTVSWSIFVNATNSSIDLSSWTFSGSGTGQRANLVGPGYLNTAGAASCNLALPGNSNCSLTFGFQDNANDAMTQPWPAADLPTPTASTLGGVESIVTTAHQWIDSISTAGVPHQSQPATSDLSDVTAPTAWTAVDGSGAGLSLTTSDTVYTKIGNVCTVSFVITYPNTTNTNPAQVSGIPAACTARNGTLSWVAGAMALDSGAGIGVVYATLQKNGQSIFFFNSGAQQTNANKSNVTVRGTITYITN